MRPLLRCLLLAALLVPAWGARAQAADHDFDGVPDPNDSCPFVPNADQADRGGVASGAPDGIGDLCQCGEVSDDGVVDLVDVAVTARQGAALAPGVSDPFRCSVAGGPWDCDGADVLALRVSLAGGVGVSQVCRAAAGSPGLPGATSAAGDSITQGFAADCTCNAGLCGLFIGLPCLAGMEQPEHSWFDGDDPNVTSLHDRYLGLDPTILADKSASLTGAEMLGDPNTNFAAQAVDIVAQQPDLVTVLLGGNDLCSRRSIDPNDPNTLYTESEWRQAVRDGLDVLVAGLPLGATVYLLGVPRVQDLRGVGEMKQAGSSSINCVAIWETFDICTIGTLFGELNDANLPTRRAALAVAQRRYNEILREEAIAYSTATDPNGINPRGIEVIADWVDPNTPSIGTSTFDPNDVNGGDCFHPSLRGQNRIAETAWRNDPRR
jgi:hypothetical protein